MNTDNPSASRALEVERQEFEAWVSALPHWRSNSKWAFERSPVPELDMYYNNRLDDMWKGWKAARAAAPSHGASRLQAAESILRLLVEAASHDKLEDFTRTSNVADMAAGFLNDAPPANVEVRKDDLGWHRFDCPLCDGHLATSAEALGITSPEHVEDVYLAVRVAAEGSDWKRDSGETLAQWVDRSFKRPCLTSRTQGREVAGARE